MYYSIIILLLVSIASFDKKSRNLGFLAVIVIYIFTSGLRYNTGSDYFSYLDIFNEVSPLNSLMPSAEDIYAHPIYIEYGFIYLISTFKLISSNFNIFLLICSAVFTVIYLFVFKSIAKDHFLTVATLYFCLSYMLLDMSGMRQFIAFSLFYFAIFSFINNRIIYTVLFLLLSSLFHSSTFFLFPSLIFIKRTNSKTLLLTIFVLSTLILLIQNFIAIKLSTILPLNFFPDPLFDKIINYTNSDFLARTRSINLMLIFFMIIFLKSIYDKSLLEQEKYKTAINLSGMYFFYTAIFSFSEDISIRMSTYFIFGPILLLSCYIDQYFKNRYFKLFILIIFCIFLLKNILFNSNFIMYQPYYNYIECLFDSCQYSFDRYSIYKLNAE